MCIEPSSFQGSSSKSLQDTEVPKETFRTGGAWRLYHRNMTLVQSEAKRGRFSLHHGCTSCTSTPQPSPAPGSSSPDCLSASLLYWLMELPYQAECHRLTRYWLGNFRGNSLIWPEGKEMVVYLAGNTLANTQVNWDLTLFFLVAKITTDISW